MATKRRAPSFLSRGDRTLKQSKLNFNTNTAPKTNASAARQVSQNEEPNEPSEKDEGAESSEKAHEKPATHENNKPALTITTESDSTTTSYLSSNPMPSSSKSFTIIEEVGDIFDAPDGTVIIHACNCLGNWGAGIAAAFKKRYPKAFADHKALCATKSPDALWGTAQLIRPMEGKGSRHYVGCLFTSRKFGRAKDSSAQILAQTGPAMEDLLRQIGEAGRDDSIKEIRICHINSGLFGVPWEKSKAVLTGLVVGSDVVPNEIIAFSLP